MLLKFSDNPFQAAYGIVRYNWKAIAWFIVMSSIAWLLFTYYKIDITLPGVPVSIMGGGLAFFLAFRNNSAYDRWWEARKIWGGVVNVSRSFAMEACTLIRGESSDRVKTGLVYRHLA